MPDQTDATIAAANAEVHGKRISAVRQLIYAMGDDPYREGLKDTPERVIRSYKELFSGYDVDVKALFTTFENPGTDQMIVVRDIDFVSFCEHHLLPFSGVAHVAYIPRIKGRVVGLSKVARVVDAFARRLQIQERLTSQIGEAIAGHLKPLGVGVILEASHSCMSCRGVRKQNAKMVTSYVQGAIADEPSARDEFLRLIGK